MRRPQADVELHVYGENFTPGSEVRFRAAISSRKGFNVRNAQISLECVETYWRTESDGKNTSQRKRSRTLIEITHEFLVNGRIIPGVPHREESALTLPADAPFTITGKQARLAWRLKLSVDVPGARDLSSEQPLIVVTPALAEDEQPSGYDPPVITEQLFDDCRLRLELPADRFRAGDSVTGRLRLDALEDSQFQGIRIELVRHEKAGVRKSSTTEQQVVLEKDAEYAASRSKEWPFTLTIPPGLWPTTRISSTELWWEIKGILNRSRRRDFSVEKEIAVS